MYTQVTRTSLEGQLETAGCRLPRNCKSAILLLRETFPQLPGGQKQSNLYGSGSQARGLGCRGEGRIKGVGCGGEGHIADISITIYITSKVTVMKF